MSRVTKAIRSVLGRHFPRSAVYEGSDGTAWFAGYEPRAPSVAAYFCGDDVSPGPSGRIWRNRLPDRVRDVAAAGGLPILRLRERDHPGLADLLERAIAVPSLVDIHTHLPTARDALRDQLKTSTTREDFRRIRKAGFSYRVTNHPDAIREFHARHYTPLVEHHYPEDGHVVSVDKMLSLLEDGGELVCADIDDVWVAGIFNLPHDGSYALRNLGIRDADDAVRQKRVIAALIVRSLERAVELGWDRATLGRSVPFLGKGPVWFKVKWGGIITSDPTTAHMHMFMDLRHEAVRSMLSAKPIIHAEGDALVASAWLEPGDKPLQATVRDSGRFPGISHWYVLGEPATIDAGAEQLMAGERIVPIPFTPSGDQPLWLADAVSDHGVSVGSDRVNA